MKTIDVIAEVMKREGIENLVVYPVTPLTESTAALGIRTIVCRQERVGVGIADGFSRVSNGKRIGAFAMQSGPGAENAFSGIASAFSDSSPMLIVAMGYPRGNAHWPRFFNSTQAYDHATKWVEPINSPEMVVDAMRRAFSRLKLGRPGPVMIELPEDVAHLEAVESVNYEPVKITRSMANARDVDDVARVLLDARAPVIHAGQGVLYAEATEELKELAELLQIPVMTSLLGKSAFPEDHQLALGTATGAGGGAVGHFLQKTDLVVGVGCSFTRHNISNVVIPDGKPIVQITNDESDINKNYPVAYPIIGDAKLVLRQLLDAVRDRGAKTTHSNGAVVDEVKGAKASALEERIPRLTSQEVPINPWRIVWELNQTLDRESAILTNDSGIPRTQLVSTYEAAGPRSFIGWGKAHALGTGLGLIMGAKLAEPDKTCVHFMGDAAIGMVGMDFETAARCEIPIISVISNNSEMVSEIPRMLVSRELYRSTDISGNYADMATALGGYGQRIENPEEIRPAILRAVEATQEGRPALLEFITAGYDPARPRY
ncbi:MAG: thiamine pyrophosphate-requiring protein [Dehalococcoidia bacterium]|nr:thiamine pyrophosphate-requiring protein [Dehalococcoidia bacterium]